MAFKFPVINPLLHSELRLKIMVALDSLESADFVYLGKITDSTRGNLSVQIKTLQESGYIDVSKSGIGPLSHTVSRRKEGLRYIFMRMVCAAYSAKKCQI